MTPLGAVVTISRAVPVDGVMLPPVARGSVMASRLFGRPGAEAIERSQGQSPARQQTLNLGELAQLQGASRG